MVLYPFFPFESGPLEVHGNCLCVGEHADSRVKPVNFRDVFKSYFRFGIIAGFAGNIASQSTQGAGRFEGTLFIFGFGNQSKIPKSMGVRVPLTQVEPSGKSDSKDAVWLGPLSARPSPERREWAPGLVLRTLAVLSPAPDANRKTGKASWAKRLLWGSLFSGVYIMYIYTHIFIYIYIYTHVYLHAEDQLGKPSKTSKTSVQCNDSHSGPCFAISFSPTQLYRHGGLIRYNISCLKRGCQFACFAPEISSQKQG